MTKLRAYYLLFSNLFAILVLLMPWPSQAADDALLSQIATQTSQHQVVESTFTQTKQMAALKRPLVTEGRLVYAQSHGVLWQIEKPYRITYVLGEDTILEIAADGSRKQRGVKDIPGMAQVARIFRAMLAADTNALRAQFNIHAEGTPSDWHISLEPREAQVRQFLRGLRLTGSKFVQSIQIDEASNDQTTITLRNIQASIAPAPQDMLLLNSLKTP